MSHPYVVNMRVNMRGKHAINRFSVRSCDNQVSGTDRSSTGGGIVCFCVVVLVLVFWCFFFCFFFFLEMLHGKL